MDLLIYYPQKGLNQNLENFSLSKDCYAIDKFFGDMNWRSIYENLKKKNQLKMIHRELINYYMERLSGLGYVEVLSEDEIGDEPLIRNSKKKAPLYRLLFASKNKLGKDFWQKVTKRDVYGQKQLF